MPHQDQQLDELKNHHKSERLSNEEKSTMKQNLLNFMNANPLQEKQPKGFTAFLRHFSTAFAALFLVVTTSFAANYSQPGDFLYPVKIYVKEEIPSYFMDDEHQQQQAVTNIERRIKEALTLIEKADLSPKREAIVTKQIEKNIEKITRLSEKHSNKLDHNPHFQKIGELYDAYEPQITNRSFENQLKNFSKRQEKLEEKIEKLEQKLPALTPQIDTTINPNPIIDINTELETEAEVEAEIHTEDSITEEIEIHTDLDINTDILDTDLPL